MSSTRFWGEIEEILDEEVKEIDSDSLEESLSLLTVGGPLKLHQPYSAEDGNLVELPEECVKMDDNIIQSIKLLEKIRSRYAAPEESNEMLLGEATDSESGTSDRNERRSKQKIKKNFMEFGLRSFSQGHRSISAPDLRPTAARQILQKSVAALIAHAGYETSAYSALETLTDLTQCFLQKLCRLVHVAVDLEHTSGSHGFPDAIEWAFFTAGLGSVTNLHTYYQENVLAYRAQLEKLAAKLPTSHLAMAPEPFEGDIISVSIKDEIDEDMDDDDVPEIHVPALGNGETSEEMQSTLEPGFQMLHSLEEEALS